MPGPPVHGPRAAPRTASAGARISRAARCTARMMRLWLPQRQRCGSSAARIAASSGAGSRVQQRRGRDQDAGEAIAALPGLLGEERQLQRVRRRRRAEPFHRHHAAPGAGEAARVQA